MIWVWSRSRSRCWYCWVTQKRQPDSQGVKGPAWLHTAAAFEIGSQHDESADCWKRTLLTYVQQLNCLSSIHACVLWTLKRDADPRWITDVESLWSISQLMAHYFIVCGLSQNLPTSRVNNAPGRWSFLSGTKRSEKHGNCGCFFVFCLLFLLQI